MIKKYKLISKNLYFRDKTIFCYGNFLETSLRHSNRMIGGCKRKYPIKMWLNDKDYLPSYITRNPVVGLYQDYFCRQMVSSRTLPLCISHTTILSLLAFVLDMSLHDGKIAATAPTIMSPHYHIRKQK